MPFNKRSIDAVKLFNLLNKRKSGIITAAEWAELDYLLKYYGIVVPKESITFKKKSRNIVVALFVVLFALFHYLAPTISLMVFNWFDINSSTSVFLTITAWVLALLISGTLYDVAYSNFFRLHTNVNIKIALLILGTALLFTYYVLAKHELGSLVYLIPGAYTIVQRSLETTLLYKMNAEFIKAYNTKFSDLF